LSHSFRLSGINEPSPLSRNVTRFFASGAVMQPRYKAGSVGCLYTDQAYGLGTNTTWAGGGEVTTVWPGKWCGKPIPKTSDRSIDFIRLQMRAGG
jgi:hypothetical protein